VGRRRGGRGWWPPPPRGALQWRSRRRGLPTNGRAAGPTVPVGRGRPGRKPPIWAAAARGAVDSAAGEGGAGRGVPRFTDRLGPTQQLSVFLTNFGTISARHDPDQQGLALWPARDQIVGDRPSSPRSPTPEDTACNRQKQWEGHAPARHAASITQVLSDGVTGALGGSRLVKRARHSCSPPSAGPDKKRHQRQRRGKPYGIQSDARIGCASTP